MHAEARDACGGEGFELQVGRRWEMRHEGRGEVVDVGDAELNMKYATRERYQRLLAQDDVMCMCVHDEAANGRHAASSRYHLF